MSYAQDPLLEPLRLLRETSLAAGFEERLALRLAAAHRDEVAPVVRLPSRRRILLVVAAIVLPAAAAAAAGYWIRQHSTTVSTEDSTTTAEAKRMNEPPRIAATNGPPLTVSATPALEELPAQRPPSASRVNKSNTRGPDKIPAPSKAVRPNAAPPTNEAPRIESLDPFVPRTTGSAKSMAVPKGPSASESLRKATEEGASRASDDRVRGSQREVNSSEKRGNEAAGQARERVQARERKGQ